MTKPKKKDSLSARCHKCGAELDYKTIRKAAAIMGSKGGKKGGKTTGASKVRDHQTLSDAAKRRWARYRAEKAARGADR